MQEASCHVVASDGRKDGRVTEEVYVNEGDDIKLFG